MTICSCFYIFFSLVSVLLPTGGHLLNVVVSVSVRRKYTTGLWRVAVCAVLERFNADVVYSEAAVGCCGVGGTMSVGFVLYQRQPIRCRELPC